MRLDVDTGYFAIEPNHGIDADLIEELDLRREFKGDI